MHKCAIMKVHFRRLLSKVLHEAIKQHEVPRHDWTWTHSFFASTGGVAVDISRADGDIEGYLPDSAPKCLRLTANSVSLLAELGHLPNVSATEIEDKSNANDIAFAYLIIFEFIVSTTSCLHSISGSSSASSAAHSSTL